MTTDNTTLGILSGGSFSIYCGNVRVAYISNVKKVYRTETPTNIAIGTIVQLEMENGLVDTYTVGKFTIHENKNSNNL